MKKFILPVGFFIFFLFFSAQVSAQDFQGCWNKQVDEDAVCGKANTECLSKCSSTDSAGRNACLSQCGDTSEACLKKNSDVYKICIEGSGKPEPATTDCWRKHMQITGCLPKFAECLGKCSKRTGDPAAQACAEGCSKTSNECSDAALAAYYACVDAQKKVQKQQEVKQLDDFSEALVEDTPAKEDFSAGDKAKEINDWIKNVIGPADLGNLAENIPGQGVVPKPVVVREPGTDLKKNYYRFSSDPSDPLVYIDNGGDRVTITTPDGRTLSPGNSDYLRVPFGTKISVKPDYPKNYAGFWISGTAPGGFVYTPGGEIEITPPEPGRTSSVKTQLKITDRYTELRWSSGSGPSIPREIEFEGQPLVKIKTKGTDFGINYNPENKKIIVEIYDGEVEVEVKGEKMPLLTAYGSPVGRMEIEKDGKVVKKTAIPKSKWQEFLASRQQNKKPDKTLENITEKQSTLTPRVLPGLLLGIFLIVSGAVVYLIKFKPAKFEYLKKRIAQIFVKKKEGEK